MSISSEDYASYQFHNVTLLVTRKVALSAGAAPFWGSTDMEFGTIFNTVGRDESI